MTLALRSRPRALGSRVVLVFLRGAFAAAASPCAGSGIAGVCRPPRIVPGGPDDPYTIGDTVTCNYTVENVGFFAAHVTHDVGAQAVPGSDADGYQLHARRRDGRRG